MSREGTGEAEVVSRSAGQGGWLAVPRHAVLLFATFLVLAPLAFAILTSLKTLNNYGLDKLGFPDPVFWGNFPTALRGGRFFLWFLNSAILSFGSVFLSTAVAALGAYAFARMEFPGRGALLAVISSLMIVPPVVMLIPLFILLTRTGLNNTYWGAILVYAGLVTPFSVYMLTNFFKTVPFEIIESAVMDGASSFEILRKILLPLSAPALITMVVVNTLWVWNDLLVALVLLNKDSLRTLMVGITVFGSRYNSDVPVAMAGMLMASVPMVLLYLFGQRYFIRGMVAGAVKG
ncbi:MAG: carbohydrate ABC transporter permease [Chloroflexi bacterium]|nr:carbohydrate ABC transporter permease [Chloroflexota bacterium]